MCLPGHHETKLFCKQQRHPPIDDPICLSYLAVLALREVERGSQVRAQIATLGRFDPALWLVEVSSFDDLQTRGVIQPLLCCTVQSSLFHSFTQSPMNNTTLNNSSHVNQTFHNVSQNLVKPCQHTHTRTHARRTQSTQSTQSTRSALSTHAHTCSLAVTHTARKALSHNPPASCRAPSPFRGCRGRGTSCARGSRSPRTP